MEYHKTELEMLKQEEAICEIDRLKVDLSHAMENLEKHHGREQFMKVLRDMRSNYDLLLAYMDGQEQIIDEKDKALDELRQILKDKALDELRQRQRLVELRQRQRLVETGRKDHD